ncbi:hypothetical protein L1987_16974 [Smallanthus sonchifolius]|uniref:Uncharacterized protein n=1 Tax=Smallanthus sonchifolius TaxID=185202 RepID=A0ACB9IWQ7_9ASTR|nr:hypothetical protein L1987_16974 [Smallanthus sonchifolius]
MKLITSLALLVISAGFIESCYGYTFYVGGKDGWVLDPRESYSHWAERNRFQVNDTLVFKYKKGLDSVLVVDEEAYNKCNKSNPEETLNDDNPVFKFKRSGPFFFISGHDEKCENGEKLIIVVMAVRHHIPIVNSTTAPPTPAPVRAPELAPAAVLQTTDGAKVHAPAPAISGVTPTGSVGLISSLGFCLILVLKDIF